MASFTPMQITPLDLFVVLAFFGLVLAVSLLRKRSDQNSESYFLAGRGLPWFVIGLSIVAANISTEQFVGMAGQGAGPVGLSVSLWQLAGSVGIVIIAFTLLPRFLRAGIYTMPEFLEYRYNATARMILAGITVAVYVLVLLTAVVYSGGLTLHTIFGLKLTHAVWLVGGIAGLYTVWGGLKSVAWADLILGMGLLLGGSITFFLALDAVGGWGAFVEANEAKLHLIRPASDEALPWTGVVGGLWIVIIYYVGLNQFIVQRNLAARSLKDGQLGLVFAGALWLIVPFAIVMPGIMSFQLYPQELAEAADKAYPVLIKNLIPEGLRGFLLASIAGAVVSSLASMLNSSATIFTIDIYRNVIRKDCSQKEQVFVGRISTLLFVIFACLAAPALSNPRFGGVFQFIQQFQGYIWPGTVAAFLMAILLKRAPGSAGVAALLCGPAFYGILQFLSTVDILPLHFLLQVLVAFLLCVAVMVVITRLRPLPKDWHLPDRHVIEEETPVWVKFAGGAVLLGVALFVGFFF